ncbi:MAG: hypothetical protein HN416_18090, partial [Nitrospina sp.]|nr:hypothetical protein [Nitrospina sp.]
KEYFSHISPENKNVASFLREVGYDYKVAGENLAMGFTTAEEVVQAWKDSPTHYANIIDGEFNDFGIGIETGKYNKIPTVYVAAHFGLQKKPLFLQIAYFRSSLSTGQSRYQSQFPGHDHLEPILKSASAADY